MIPDHLRIQPGQEALTPEQEAEVQRFADEYICNQLSTEPVHEPETEALVCQVYQVAGLAPPQFIRWVDGPLHLVAALAPPSIGASLQDSIDDSTRASLEDSTWASLEERLGGRATDSLRAILRPSFGRGIKPRINNSVWNRVGDSIHASVWGSLAEYLEASTRASLEDSLSSIIG